LVRLALLLPYVLERRRELALLLVGRLACRLERLLLLAPQVLDRGRVLLAQPGSREAFQAAAEDLRTTHAIVIGSIVLLVVTGVALATSDIGTFAVSKVFWMKMAMFVILIANGAFMRRTEGRLLAAAADAGVAVDQPTPWPSLQLTWVALKRSAAISLMAWFAIVLLGVVLSDI
jgi:hypothetical protein